MSHATEPRTKPEGSAIAEGGWPDRDGLFRFTVDQFYQLSEMGLFGDRHVELIEGVIYEMTSKPPHALAVELIDQLIRIPFGQGFRVRCQLLLDRGRRSMPEPDFAILPGGPREAPPGHPTTAALIIEISDTTLRKDRVLKGHLYAHAGIADYWILNLNDRQLEIYRNPGPDPSRKGRFKYHDTTILSADGHASPLARPEARIAVADMLP
jgi:Uma2 family endonuclease